MNRKLTTVLACDVASLDRDRFNEAVAGGYLTCVPETVAGRARTFEPDDILPLWYYRELLQDGYGREKAGHIACEITRVARLNPECPAISYLTNYFVSSVPGDPKVRAGEAYPWDQLPEPSDWNTKGHEGSNPRSVHTFNVSWARRQIAHHTARVIAELEANG